MSLLLPDTHGPRSTKTRYKQMHPVSDNDPASRCTAAVISKFFEQNIKDARAVSDSYELLWQEMYRLIQSGGKRLRPKMVYMAYQAFGGNDLQAVAPVAAATELLHLSMLIHDDIIDRDIIRYGVPNIVGSYLAHYTPLIVDHDARQHYAESAAILGGDLLLSAAHQLIVEADIEPARKLQAQRYFSRSIFEVAGGELIDTEAAFHDPSSVDPMNIARYKTAGYSFISPLCIGATLAGADTAMLDLVRQFAEQLGIAFQLQDDILGMFGNVVTTGKSNSSDIREGKRNYLIVCFEKEASASERREFNRYFGSPDITEAEAAIVRDAIMRSGARSQVELKIKQLEAEALCSLAGMKLSVAHHNTFLELIQMSLQRSS